MPAVDLDAELIPGTSAAGWQIGTLLADCSELLQGAVEVDYRPGVHLRDAVSRNTGVLVVRNYFPAGSGHTAVYFKDDVVRFQFNAAGELFCIFVFPGYLGRALGQVGIGSSLEEIRQLFPLTYDAGDEMYYPDFDLCPTAPRGIAFEAGDEQPGGTPISGICIHDWDLIDRCPRD